MHFFSILNIIADLAIFWLHASVTRTEDREHPLATYVTYSTAPYFFNMLPTIENSALFSVDVSQMKDYKETLRTFDYIIFRDSVFKSIMLCAFVFIIVWAGVLMASGLISCIKYDRKMNRSELILRTAVPCAVGVVFSMAFYNGAFEFHYKMKYIPNIPLMILNLGHLLLFISFVCGNQLFSARFSRFMFSNYESFVRLIFVASVLFLEPFISRFRFRDRFYRTTNETTISPIPQPVQVVSPLPRKMNVDDIPPNYENTPPAYEAAQGLPAVWTITPPSRQYPGAPQMTPVEGK